MSNVVKCYRLKVMKLGFAVMNARIAVIVLMIYLKEFAQIVVEILKIRPKRKISEMNRNPIITQ